MKTEAEVKAMLDTLTARISGLTPDSESYIHVRAEIHILRWVLGQFNSQIFSDTDSEQD